MCTQQSGSAPTAISGAVIGELFDAESRGTSTLSLTRPPPRLCRWGLDSREINAALGGASPFRNLTITIFPDVDEISSGRHPSKVPLFKYLARLPHVPRGRFLPCTFLHKHAFLL
jgi:hypothetical protein